jgi:iron complex transport system substrate-binding protein
MLQRSFGRWLGLALVLGALALGGFANDGTADTQVVVVDDRGEEIVIDETPTRVVVAGTPLYTEIMVDIGATDALVGVTESANNPPEVEGVERIGPSFPSPNVERIVELEPDVVFGAIRDVRERLESAGLTVVTPRQFISSVPAIFDMIRTIGLVMDRSVEAELLVGEIGAAMTEIESRVLTLDRPRAAFLFASSDGPPFAGGSDSMQGKLLARAGGENVFADVSGVSQVSLEAVVARDPQVIFTDPSQIERLMSNERLAEVAAIANDRVHGIPASTITSTRVAEALRQIAEQLHPDAFGGSAEGED